MIFTRSFLVAAAERAVKTFAQALLAFIPAAGTGAIPDLNWGDMLVLAGYAALGSVLFSVVSSGISGPGPSMANEVIPAGDAADDGHADIVTVLIATACAIVVLVVYVAFVR